jgi:hypothetical protein
MKNEISEIKKPTLSLISFAVIGCSLLNNCKKSKSNGEVLVVETSPARGNVQAAAAPGPDFPLYIVIKSTFKKDQANESPFFTKSASGMWPIINLTSTIQYLPFPA